jgi:hypothetical protein
VRISFAPISLGILTLLSSVVLLVWNVRPGLFPERAHDVLGALPLALIAVAWLVQQAVRRASWRDVVKAVLLAAAFLFWAANQLWPELPQATLFNDIAIVLFVLDVFFALVGWPAPAAVKTD